MGTMGTFHTACRVENHKDDTRSAEVSNVLVDTGLEMTWLPSTVLEQIGVEPKKQLSFQMANGSVINRSVGFAVLRVGKDFTVDEVVFAQPGDLNLLGARTLEGLNLRVDSRSKKLVSAGPILAA